MATTTNYGWTTPDDTALVKDGASAIRTLGSSIDSTLKTQIDAQIPDALLTTKGDLIAATGASTPARLAVGTNDQVLIADSTAATGIKWGAAPAGGMTQLATGSLSGSPSTSITSISGSYKNLYLTVRNQYTTLGDLLQIRLNNASTSIYDYVNIRSSTTTVSATAATSQFQPQTTSGTTDTKSSLAFFIYDYADANAYKSCNWFAANFGSAMQAVVGGGGFSSTSAITSIQILNNGTSQNFAGGTYTLYGVK